MTSNPLARRRSEEPMFDLWQYAEWLNGLGFVRASERPYFVSSRLRPDQSLEQFLDRKA